MKLSFTTSYWLKYLCVLLTIISLAITITIHFTPLYYWQEFQHHLAQSVGLTRTQLFHNYHQLFLYALICYYNLIFSLFKHHLIT